MTARRSEAHAVYRLLLSSGMLYTVGMDDRFFVRASELTLRFVHPTPPAYLAFRPGSDWGMWQLRARNKLSELLNVYPVTPGKVRTLRTVTQEGVSIEALVMQVDDTLSIPAYLLTPRQVAFEGAVMAIHGHGEVEPCLGQRDDYHHRFAWELAKAGHRVLCPELRGFGALSDLAAQAPEQRLDYWSWGQHMAYSLVTDAFLKGFTLLGATVEDLLRWEHWLAGTHAIQCVRVAGISYGGDLAIMYPVFSQRVGRIFASGTLGSFSAIFSRCHNAPAHCIPGVLLWLDRADIAGINAPRPMAVHYGELDTPSPTNGSASYNETVMESIARLRTIYAAAGASGNVQLIVSPGKGHEMDIEALLRFMRA